jgi:hypothetical protein
MSRLALASFLALALAACDSDRLLAPSPAKPASPNLATALTSPASQDDADAISGDIQSLHLPYGTIIDPRFRSSDPNDPGYSQLADNAYTHIGDAAIWTGHYLAAEAFRYRVTKSSAALDNFRKTLDGITMLLDVTGPPGGNNVLARFYAADGWQYAAAVQAEESKRGIYHSTINGVSYFWIGQTSRDQYSGVFFGLGAAYDLLDPLDPSDAALRTQIASNVTRMLNFLLLNAWSVRMPDNTFSTTFFGRPDQQLTFLQIGRHVNPARFALLYRLHRALLAGSVRLPIQAECQDTHGSYFKFNLDYINLYNLIRLEKLDEPGSPFLALYLGAYDMLRACTGTHDNAHFNMIDYVVKGIPNATRDGDTRRFLDLWVLRTRRDDPVDRSGEVDANGQPLYPACGPNLACSPLPVDKRPTNDFLWQRDPYVLSNGGSGLVEFPGIDFILPYWMARQYGVMTS